MTTSAENNDIRTELERQLVNEAQNGSSSYKWYDFFDQYVGVRQRDLLDTAYRITRCTHSAQDIVQESFIAFHDHLIDKGLDGNVGSWLTKVVINNALQHIRNGKRSYSPLSEEMLIDDDQASLPMEQRERLDRVLSIMDRVLTPQEKQVVEYKLLRDWPFDTISQCMQISQSTVERYFYRAIDKIRERFFQQGE